MRRKIEHLFNSLSVCGDCMMYIANGETPIELDWDETQEWIAKFEKNTEGYIVIPGNESLGFCHSRCDTCKGLAGDRERAFMHD